MTCGSPIAALLLKANEGDGTRPEQQPERAAGGACYMMPKMRTHSLFRQGCMLYELIPNMPEHRLLPLMQQFAEMLARSGLFCWLQPEAQ
jgi:hypothetical protein